MTTTHWILTEPSESSAQWHELQYHPPIYVCISQAKLSELEYYVHFFYPICVLRHIPPICSWFHHFNILMKIWRNVRIMYLTFMQFSPVSFLLGPNILRCTPSSNTFSLRFVPFTHDEKPSFIFTQNSGQSYRSVCFWKEDGKIYRIWIQ
jgi:hypothetical protein